jgi:formylglycine-generating enzyme required for sulfatase activity
VKYFLVLIFVAALSVGARAVTIDLVPIGNPGNASDLRYPQSGLFGHVATSYQIGKTEVTNAQYLEFLNAKAASDPYGLYNPAMANFEGGIIQNGSSGSYTYTLKDPVPGAGIGGTAYTYGDKPIVSVTWYDAIRFANWMNNGQGSGNTETGAYTLTGGTPVPTNATTITRNANATWFLPSENEWYKAAYYNPVTSSYLDYPTGFDASPDNQLPTSDSGNSVNYLVGSNTTTGDPAHPYTPAGAYTLTRSPYGTLDQGGNAAEWNEALVTNPTTITRGARGGAWDTDSTSLQASTRGSAAASPANPFLSTDIGFRLARTTAAAISVPGDYNNNGVVDMADYVVWRVHLGTSFQLANEVSGSTPGTVTQEDYAAWRSRFGNTSGAGSGIGLQGANVPEPRSWLLLAAVGVVAVFSMRRRPALNFCGIR